MNTGQPLLRVEDLSVKFKTTQGMLPAVDGLSFDMTAGETVALVGETGCGKSTAALAITRLLAQPPAVITARSIHFDGRELIGLPEAAMRELRGRSIAMVFQDPSAYLNPTKRIGRQIGEVLELHLGLDRPAAKARAIELLRLTGLPAAEERIHAYPHNLSGGMRQRVMIAIALACNPQLLIADEPTTALDVTVQAQVMELLRSLKERLGMALLLITHDLGIVAETAQHVIVMYAGRKVEQGTVADIFGDPRHPYTQGLIGAAQLRAGGDGDLVEIPGSVPSPAALPSGCAFEPRCPHAMPRCRVERPALVALGAGREAACFLLEETAP
ncbi:MAG: ABC transporter ATP-binding protein [Casimicrobiaceae bacterium]